MILYIDSTTTTSTESPSTTEPDATGSTKIVKVHAHVYAFK